MKPLLVMTNLPDQASAEALAAVLVDGRLAACVNILAPCRSVYEWQGATERADEVPLLIKTSEERYPALEAALRSSHPYKLPAIVALPVVQALPAFADWVITEVNCPVVIE